MADCKQYYKYNIKQFTVQVATLEFIIHHDKNRQNVNVSPFLFSELKGSDILMFVILQFTLIWYEPSQEYINQLMTMKITTIVRRSKAAGIAGVPPRGPRIPT